MDRGQFVAGLDSTPAGLDSTRASAELDSQSRPSVTRLFEARMRLGQCNYVELIDTIFTDVEGVD
jgi:hypothetical protein